MSCNYKRTLEDPTILDRITEDEVAAWLAAKMADIRQKTPLSTLSLTVWFRNYRNDPHYDIDWNGHAADKCASHGDLSQMLKELRAELLGNPAARASEKRWKAKSLNEEAAQLESLAGKANDLESEVEK